MTPSGHSTPNSVNNINQLHISYLIISQTNQDHVRLVDPDFLPQLSSDVTQPLHTIETHGFETSIT